MSLCRHICPVLVTFAVTVAAAAAAVRYRKHLAGFKTAALTAFWRPLEAIPFPRRFGRPQAPSSRAAGCSSTAAAEVAVAESSRPLRKMEHGEGIERQGGGGGASKRAASAEVRGKHVEGLPRIGGAALGGAACTAAPRSAPLAQPLALCSPAGSRGPSGRHACRHAMPAGCKTNPSRQQRILLISAE